VPRPRTAGDQRLAHPGAERGAANSVAVSAALAFGYRKRCINRAIILQWFVPGVEFFGGLGVAVGFLTPLAAIGLLVICSVALLANSPTVVASYKPIDSADRVDDWLYQPEVMYALMLIYFITAGAGPVSVDQLLKLWIG
jgi:uncharacterized membrane protein YphA (DoxX/SURF4 family)